ncbi:tetratricopeptide repeat protein [Magnetospirillum sp. UT-4]|uniref:tetratricopeptide repeat protein n=1 Tax=Magnetospirillum sp. UT-4 TaxID=2681467 RepID=UPI00138347D9|nr:tetratricopeptide repeat protein [Magnetospirillum sp. UT-4]CAA7627022.1 conserved hypothetical protein [Magnetospirillum sp. UT-4]
MTDAADALAEIARLEGVIAEFRARIAAEPDSAFPAFADALMGLAALLADGGQHDRALAAAEEGVEHFRVLYEVDAGVFGIHLASALNNCSNRLSDLGRDDEARRLGDEAFMLGRGALEGQPDQARFVLVSVLMNQAGRSWRAGQGLRALEELGTAVELFREGGEAVMGYLGVMVDALHRNAMALSEAGRWEEAIAVRRMCADIFPPDAIPYAVLHLLALTLQQGAFAKSRDGFPGEALPLVEEAAELARALAEVNPDQYRLFLAQSLANLASRQHEARADEEALDAALEAVTAFQELTKTDPGAALVPLIGTLETFASILTALGQHEQAATIVAQRAQLLEVVQQVQAGQGQG